jgi:predicted nucleic-acid-binding protein
VIALDTNILVRYFVRDDPKQTAIARRLLEHGLTAEETGFVSLAVIVELAWVLNQVYQLSSEDVRQIVRQLLSAREIEVESADVLEVALGHRQGDLADAIIHELGVQQGCAKTVTFDRRLARLHGVELLKAG